MNRICVFISLGLLVFYGCVGQKKAVPQNISQKADSSRRRPLPQPDKEFPQFLVGVWQADDSNWGFKFEPDGKISKLTHVLGVPMKVDEGSYYEEGIAGSSFLYVLGPCDTSYDPKTKILKVSVVMDYFLMDIPPAGTLEGSEKDIFEGPVSANPLRRGRTAAKDLIWNVKWRSYCTVEEASPPDVNFIDANPENLVFRKLDLKIFEEHKHHPAPPVRQHGE